VIYELRVYRALPDRMPALLKRFENHTRPALPVGPESMAEREQCWNALGTDP
jgi:hypothetical protein